MDAPYIAPALKVLGPVEDLTLVAVNSGVWL